VLSVKELVFRGKDRYRSYTWMPLLVLGFGLVVAGIPTAFRVGNTLGLCWFFGLATAVSGIANFIVFRSWTRVGPAGITICRGIGRRGRTYPWQEIRWVDIRETKTNRGTSLAARITLSDGRRRSLPALFYGYSDADPNFDRDVARVVRWWESSTDPAARYVPPDTLLSRRLPTVLGVILLLLIAVTVLLVIHHG